MKYAVFLLIQTIIFGHLNCKNLPTLTNTTNTEDTVSGYKQCKATNEACTTNNDCCTNCCTSATYTPMTCQTECPEPPKDDVIIDIHLEIKGQTDKKNNNDRTSQTKNSQSNSQIGKSMISNENVDDDNDGINEELGESISLNHETKERQIEVSGVIIKKYKIKDNDQIGTSIIDPLKSTDNDNKETITKDTKPIHKNIEIGLSVLNMTNIVKDEIQDVLLRSKENKEMGGSVIKVKNSQENERSTSAYDRKSKDRSNTGKNVKDGENQTFENKIHSNMISTKDTKNNVGSKTNNEIGHTVSKSVKVSRKEEVNSSSDYITREITTLKRTEEIAGAQPTPEKEVYKNPYSKTIVNGEYMCEGYKVKERYGHWCKANLECCAKCCAGELYHLTHTCILINCTESLLIYERAVLKQIPTRFPPPRYTPLPYRTLPSSNQNVTSTRAKPVCKVQGSECSQAAECCTGCCAFHNGMFQCFEAGTDECQSSSPLLPGQCIASGYMCQKDEDCCGGFCMSYGAISRCDDEIDYRRPVKHVNHAQIIIQVEQPKKLCKNLGDTCVTAADCCTECCAFSAGNFQCFEEGTHECQSGDHVTNETLSRDLDGALAAFNNSMKDISKRPLEKPF